MRRRESETGRNRQYFTWCWCANKTLISYMWHQATHTAFKHTNSISTSHRHICFGRITANEQEHHYTVWPPRQSFTLQFTRHAIVLKNSEMSGAGRHYSVTKLQGKCSLKGALCSFLVNKLHTKIWITCIQMCRILQVVFFDESCRLLALRGTHPWIHRSSGCRMIFSRSNNQWM